ncbi:MAG: hypothetical protein Q7J86_07465 [Bacteroidota bacterium]|nr:hypothetical protein [Bacteroidota bacterium]
MGKAGNNIQYSITNNQYQIKKEKTMGRNGDWAMGRQQTTIDNQQRLAYRKKPS